MIPYIGLATKELLRSYQLTYVGTELCVGIGIQCCEFMCSKHVLISFYFNAILEFPVQLYAVCSNVVQKCV
jgi:hypothetical protein